MSMEEASGTPKSFAAAHIGLVEKAHLRANQFVLINSSDAVGLSAIMVVIERKL